MRLFHNALSPSLNRLFRQANFIHVWTECFFTGFRMYCSSDIQLNHQTKVHTFSNYAVIPTNGWLSPSPGYRSPFRCCRLSKDLFGRRERGNALSPSNSCGENRSGAQQLVVQVGSWDRKRRVLSQKHAPDCHQGLGRTCEDNLLGLSWE